MERMFVYTWAVQFLRNSSGKNKTSVSSNMWVAEEILTVTRKKLAN